MLKNTGEWKGDVLIDSNNQSQPESILSLVCFSHQGPADLQPYLSFVGRDISQQKQLERHCCAEATHDELTTLPNRHSLMDHLQDAFARTADAAKSPLHSHSWMWTNSSVSTTAWGIFAAMVYARQPCARTNCLRADDLVSRLGAWSSPYPLKIWNSLKT
ncbi:MAG: GGDEF domain-containing protein [Gammaproteobacteria bacterium]